MRPLALAAALLLSACGGDASGDTEGTPADEPGAAPSLSEAAGAMEAAPPAAPQASGGAATAGATVVDVIGRTPALSTVARLVQTAGLAETLGAEGPYTLFAPSDDALAGADLPATPEAARALLLAHALPFRTLAADMDFEQTVETMGGTSVDVIPGAPPAVASGGTRARITAADLDAANGVVHVISAPLPSN